MPGRWSPTEQILVFLTISRVSLPCVSISTAVQAYSCEIHFVCPACRTQFMQQHLSFRQQQAAEALKLTAVQADAGAGRPVGDDRPVCTDPARPELDIL